MKVLAQTMDSALGKRIGGYLPPENIYEEKDVFGVGHVRFNQAFLEREGSEQHYRPYLRLVGSVVDVSGDFPMGVTTFRFGDERHRPLVQYVYHFNNVELSQLCLKGMFDDGFSVPDLFEHTTFELPMNLDMRMVAPEADDEAPLAFLRVQDAYGIDIDGVVSGYENLAQYFEQARGPEHDDVTDVEYADERNVAIDYSFEQPVQAAVTEQKPAVELTDDEKLILQMADEIMHRAEQRAQRKLVQDTPEAQESQFLEDDASDPEVAATPTLQEVETASVEDIPLPAFDEDDLVDDTDAGIDPDEYERRWREAQAKAEVIRQSTERQRILTDAKEQQEVMYREEIPVGLGEDGETKVRTDEDYLI